MKHLCNTCITLIIAQKGIEQHNFCEFSVTLIGRLSGERLTLKPLVNRRYQLNEMLVQDVGMWYNYSIAGLFLNLL